MDLIYITAERYPDLNKKMTFGKYKGCTIEEVLYHHPSYIVWCINNVRFFKINEELENEIIKRYEDDRSNKYGCCYGDSDADDYGFSPAYIDGDWLY
jgi:hypothetical protein